MSNEMDFLNVTLKLDGPSLHETIVLHDLITILGEMQTIVDKTYLVLNDRYRITKQDREVFQITASKFERGSFIAQMEIVIKTAQLVLPFVIQSDPVTLWKCTVNSFELLKAIYDAKKSNQAPPTIKEDNHGQIINVNGDNNIIFAPKQVIQIAKQARPHYEKLANRLEQKKIETFELYSPNRGKIKLTHADNDTFRPMTYVDDSPVQIIANIFDFNKETNSGKLRVYRDQGVPPGEYSFSAIGNQDSVNYILSMAKASVELTVLKEIEIDPFEGERIHRLQIIKISNVAA